MKKIMWIFFFVFFFLSFSGSVTAQEIWINVTEEVLGIVPTFTWGVNLWSVDGYSLVDGFRKSGVTLGVIDMSLQDIFRYDETPDFSQLDRIIYFAKSNGIVPELIVAYMPVWLARNGSVYDPPKNMTKFLELVKTVVGHVKDDVTYYEIWGEPNIPNYHWTGDEKEYRELLANVSETIRKVDSDAVIIAPSLSTIEPKWFERDRVINFTREVCLNANNYFDIFSFYLYSFPPDNWPSFIKNFKQILSEYGCNDKPLWMTESSIWKSEIKWNYLDVLEVAKGKKALLDNDIKAQVYFPFRTLWTNGLWQGLYNSINKTFTPIGKYYQLATKLKFYGNKLKVYSNIQDNISKISFIAVKNLENNIIVQITNNNPLPQEIQINFPKIKNFTIYESSSEHDLDFPLFFVSGHRIELTLKPYSVYLVEAKPIGISGELKNTTYRIDANISIYNEGTDVLNVSQKTLNGNYEISLWPNVYDLKFDFFSFPNLFIKFVSFPVYSNVINVINNINKYDNELSFTLDVHNDQEIQVYSEEEPKIVTINGTRLVRVFSKSELATNKWYYNSSEKMLYIVVNPLECSDGTPYEECSITKPLYCSNGKIVNNCSYCGCNLGYDCNLTTGDCNPVKHVIIFEDGFESGSLSAWDGVIGTPSVTPNQKYEGFYGLECNSSGDFIYKGFTNQKIIYVKDYFKFSKFPKGSGQIRFLRLFYGSGAWGSIIARLILEWTGSYGLTLHLEIYYPYQLTFSYPISIQNNTWYPFEFKFIKESENGEYKVWFNGSEIITVTNLNTSYSGNMIKIALGNIYSNIPTSVWVDSVKITN